MHTGGNIERQGEQITTSVILCEKTILKYNLKVLKNIFLSMVKFSFICCGFVFFAAFFFFLFFPLLSFKVCQGKKKFKLLGLSHGSFSHMNRFLLYLVVFIAILLSLCISAAGSGLKQTFAGNWKKVFVVCECVFFIGWFKCLYKGMWLCTSSFPCLLILTLEQNLGAIYVVNHE